MPPATHDPDNLPDELARLRARIAELESKAPALLTDRKRVEDALEENRRALATLLSNLPGMAYRCRNDRQWTMQFVSDGCRELTGYDRDELIGNRALSYSDLIVPEDRDRVWSEVQAALTRKAPFRLTYGIQAKDGTFKWVWEQGRGVCDSDGNLLALEGFITDITEQKSAVDLSRLAQQQLENHVRERTHELTTANERLEYEIAERKRLDWLLRAIVDNIPIMLFVKEAETLNVELWNHAAEKLTGISASEIVGKTGLEVFPPEQMAAFFQRDREVIARKHLVAAEEPISTKQGERQIYTQKIPMFDEQGNAKYLVGISEDITERKRAIAELDERARLATLGAEVGVAVTREGSLRGMLQQCTEIMVRNLHAAFARIWTWDEADQSLELHASAGMYTHLDGPHGRIPLGDLKIGRIAQSRRPHLTNDLQRDPQISDPLWADREGLQAFAGYPLMVGEQLIGVMAIFARERLSDATINALGAMADGVAVGIQNKWTEAALRQSLERFDLMVRGAKVGLWDAMVVADEPYRPDNPIYYSPRFKEMLGFAAHEFPDVIGSWAERLFPADRDRVFQALDDQLFRRIPFDIEYRMINRAGELRWFAARAQVQWGVDGKPVRMSGSFSDITDRKESEQQLWEAREAADAANRAKTRFLANISHEIRTPIAAMLGATELLAQPEVSDQERLADLILRNGRHLLSLIDDLLDFSRLEAGKLEISRVPCSLVEVLTDIRAVIAPLCTKPQVEFRFEVASELPEVIVTDPTRLRQAVINLVNNALKYTEEGWVVLRVTAYPDAPDPRLVLEVSDSGVGIAPEELVRVFEPFERVSHPGAGIISGVGLGLTITRWIAAQLGGDLSARSTPGKGSTFTLRIATGPCARTRWIPAEEWTESPVAHAGLSCRMAPDRLCGSVLLAEDYADTREVLEYALTAAGAEVTSVDNGIDAVAEALRRPFDLILMDIRMPRLDGLGAVAQLRANGCLTPIIALTASTAFADRRRILDAGFDDFWTKPISLERFIQGASAYLAAGSVPSAAPAVALASSDTMNSKWQRLSREFIAGLPERIHIIHHLIADGKAPEAAERIHQLIGSAGIHGLDAICSEAVRLQRLFRESHTLTLEQLGPLERAVASVLS